MIARIACMALCMLGLTGCYVRPGPQEYSVGGLHCIQGFRGAECQLGRGNYFGFTLGMSKAAAYENACSGPARPFMRMGMFREPIDNRYHREGYEDGFSQDKEPICGEQERALGYDDWLYETRFKDCQGLGVQLTKLRFVNGRLSSFQLTCDEGWGPTPEDEPQPPGGR